MVNAQDSCFPPRYSLCQFQDDRCARSSPTPMHILESLSLPSTKLNGRHAASLPHVPTRVKGFEIACIRCIMYRPAAEFTYKQDEKPHLSTLSSNREQPQKRHHHPELCFGPLLSCNQDCGGYFLFSCFSPVPLLHFFVKGVLVRNTVLCKTGSTGLRATLTTLPTT